MTQLAVALLGLGRAGSTLHLPALRRIGAARVVAAADPDAPGRERARAAGIEVTADWRRALEPDVDAVLVATPPATHFELAAAALAARKHVYVEKPMTTSLASARELAELAGRSGKTLQVGFAYRYHPLWRRVHALAASGRAGPLVRAHGQFTTARAGDGWSSPVVDLASHHLDLLSWLTGSPPDEVEARSPTELRARWASGAEFDGAYREGGPADAVELEFAQGTVIVDRLAGVRLRGRGVRLGVGGLPDPGLVRARAGGRGWERSFESALRAFVAAAVEGRPGWPGADAGLAAVAGAEATLRSLANARAEPVGPGEPPK
ncbi:MAG: Gfo/Idh/MocA family oxidoreductase [Gaiellaceae bacterium]